MPFKDDETRRAYQRTRYHRTKGGQRLNADGSSPHDRPVRRSYFLKLSLVSNIQRIVLEGLARGTYPYTTVNDAVEDLLIRGIETLDGELAQIVGQHLRAIRSVDGIGSLRRETQSAYSRTKAELAELLSIHDEDAARAVYWYVVDEFRKAEPSTWRDWFLVTIKKEHPQLANARPKAVSMQPEKDHIDPPRKGEKDPRKKLLDKTQRGHAKVLPLRKRDN